MDTIILTGENCVVDLAKVAIATIDRPPAPDTGGRIHFLIESAPAGDAFFDCPNPDATLAGFTRIKTRGWEGHPVVTIADLEWIGKQAKWPPEQPDILKEMIMHRDGDYQIHAAPPEPVDDPFKEVLEGRPLDHSGMSHAIRKAVCILRDDAASAVRLTRDYVIDASGEEGRGVLLAFANIKALVKQLRPVPPEIVREIGARMMGEMDAASAKSHQAMMGAFARNMNPEATYSYFDMDLGPRAGIWNVTFQRISWGVEERQS